MLHDRAFQIKHALQSVVFALCCVLEMFEGQCTMSTAWGRFDAEAQQLKRLCAQISAQISAPSVPASVPANLHSQSRRQSAASRRAIAGLQSNVPPQSAVAVGPAALMSHLSDAALQSHGLHCSPAAAMSRPCTTSCTYSTSTIQAAAVTGSHVCPPTVCSLHIATSGEALRPALGVSGSELDAVHVAWTGRPRSESDHTDESAHLVISTSVVCPASEAVTPDSVIDVSADVAQPASAGTRNESYPRASQLVMSYCRDVEG